MNVLVAYDSYFINTKCLAEAVAKSLADSGAKVILERIYQVNFSSWAGFDLLMVGTPTHNQGMPRPLKSVLKRLPEDLFAGLAVQTFDTRYKMPVRKSGSAAKQVQKLLEKHGSHPLSAPESFFVQERGGPLFPGELERASAWAASICSLLELPA